MVRDMTDPGPYAPFILFAYDHRPGTYCLLLSDRDMTDVMDVFEAGGSHGNGYGWTEVARHAADTRLPQAGEPIGYDPEAGMFVAFGRDLALLQALGEILRDAFHDRALLAELV